MVKAPGSALIPAGETRTLCCTHRHRDGLRVFRLEPIQPLLFLSLAAEGNLHIHVVQLPRLSVTHEQSAGLWVYIWQSCHFSELTPSPGSRGHPCFFQPVQTWLMMEPQTQQCRHKAGDFSFGSSVLGKIFNSAPVPFKPLKFSRQIPKNKQHPAPLLKTYIIEDLKSQQKREAPWRL